MTTDQLTHKVEFNFRGIRCRWRCSCDNSKISTFYNSFLGAFRASQKHLVQCGGDLNQPHATFYTQDF